MTRQFSHEFAQHDYVKAAHNERAEALARAGFLVIAAADRAVRRTAELLATGAASLVNGWQQYQDRHATYREQSKLDDRLLRDIGLSRADIEGSAGDLSQLEAAIEDVVPPRSARPVLVHDLKRAA
jgi:uncharacterized protein YjiS (DUF1127 family)